MITCEAYPFRTFANRPFVRSWRRRQGLQCVTSVSCTLSWLHTSIAFRWNLFSLSNKPDFRPKSYAAVWACFCVPSSKGGFNGSVIFIDTENTFVRSERVHQIAGNRGIEPGKILQKIFVCKVRSSAYLELVAQNLGKSIQQCNAKLVIIDSIISHRSLTSWGRDLVGRSMLS